MKVSAEDHPDRYRVDRLAFLLMAQVEILLDNMRGRYDSTPLSRTARIDLRRARKLIDRALQRKKR